MRNKQGCHRRVGESLVLMGLGDSLNLALVLS